MYPRAGWRRHARSPSCRKTAAAASPASGSTVAITCHTVGERAQQAEQLPPRRGHQWARDRGLQRDRDAQLPPGPAHPRQHPGPLGPPPLRDLGQVALALGGPNNRCIPAIPTKRNTVTQILRNMGWICHGMDMPVGRTAYVGCLPSAGGSEPLTSGPSGTVLRSTRLRRPLPYPAATLRIGLGVPARRCALAKSWGTYRAQPAASGCFRPHAAA